ncbi:PAQR family membrane homeostasis protein TrhA [Nafulsella turpanensis]|uniref:PAQR family membrane homeostasis protein TrhA n=1 Tax=Nafulsella turpanensis TaxID=1265690 RepID=UPI000349D223|nr:hemolysin III family protein [Nafulsella turpanensis]
MQVFTYTRKQELANSLTHGLGVLLSIAGIVILFSRAASQSISRLDWGALLIYSVSLLMVYVNSTIYHAARSEAAKHLFKVLDHISIYFLIAGTTTFFVVYYTDKSFSTTAFLVAQWLLVLAGTIFKIFFTGRFKVLSTFLYIALGLMVLLIIRTLWLNIPPTIFSWIIAGGIFYISGTIFYLWKKLYYQHAIWHLFVLCGSISHYIALLYSLQPTS